MFIEKSVLSRSPIYVLLVVILLLCQSFPPLMAMEEKEIDPDQTLVSIKRSPQEAKPPRSPRNPKQPEGNLSLVEALKLKEQKRFNKIRSDADQVYQKYLREKKKKRLKQYNPPPAAAK